jgi:hypothetical protein
MKSLLIFPLLIGLFLRGLSNENKSYVSTKNGVIIFMEGGWDTVAMQKLLDEDLNFILDNINKPPELKIFIVLGAYGIRTPRRRNNSPIFISVAYDSLSNTDTIYDPLHNGASYSLEFRLDDYKYPNDMYPGNLPLVNKYLRGLHGLKIYYHHDVRDTANYYNHLLSVVEYAIKHLEEIKIDEKRICLPGEYDKTEISILTYDTSKLNAIPIKNWGFTIDPEKRHYKNNKSPVTYATITVLFVTALLILFGIRLKKRNI